jgi:hypothetical protein
MIASGAIPETVAAVVTQEGGSLGGTLVNEIGLMRRSGCVFE